MDRQSWPRTVSRKTSAISPWIELIEREVEFERGAVPETYHAIGVQDYIHIVARTPDGCIPLVRQYRPALERSTIEIPAGLLEEGEQAAAAASRELLEETGFLTSTIHPLGTYSTDPGRLGNATHSFFIETKAQATDFLPEPHVDVLLVREEELYARITAGELCAQGQICTVLLAVLRGHLTSPWS